MVIPSKVNRHSCMNNIVHVHVGWGQQKGKSARDNTVSLVICPFVVV